MKKLYVCFGLGMIAGILLASIPYFFVPHHVPLPCSVIVHDGEQEVMMDSPECARSVYDWCKVFVEHNSAKHP